MQQNWITVAGIAIDLLGFLLLLREWWLAFFHESSVLEAEKRQSWERSLRHQHQTHAPEALKGHLQTSARIHDQMAEQQARARHIATLKSRKGMFMLATALILIGYTLQIIGSLPIELF
jgi:hypothetical protein